MTERLGEFQLLTTLYMSPPPPPPPLSVSKAPEPQRQAAVEKDITDRNSRQASRSSSDNSAPRSRSPARRSCINDFGNIFRHAQRRRQLGFFYLHRFGFARRESAAASTAARARSSRRQCQAAEGRSHWAAKLSAGGKTSSCGRCRHSGSHSHRRRNGRQGESHLRPANSDRSSSRSSNALEVRAAKQFLSSWRPESASRLAALPG